MAHIFAAQDTGPRADVELSEKERGAFKNLLLLCPTCHTRVDKAEADFPYEMILEWKHLHLEKIKKGFWRPKVWVKRGRACCY